MLTKIRQLHGELGTGPFLLYGLSKGLAMAGKRARLYRYLLVAQPVPDKPLLPIRANSPIRIHQIEQCDYQYHWFPRPQAFIDARYDQGSICFVAFKNDIAIGCLWLQLGSYYEDEVRCLFMPIPAEQCCWDYDVYIEPQYRAGRVFMYLWDHAYGWLREQRIQWSMSRINAFNVASIRSHERMGMRPIYTATFICLGQWQLLLSPRKPFIHCSRSAIPQLAILAPSAETGT